MATWLEEFADRPVASDGSLTKRGDSYGPCPSCNADRRGSEDRRGPIGLTRDGKGWRCHASGCDAEGDFADLVAYRLFGKRVRDLTPDQTRELRAEGARRGYCPDPAPHGVSSPSSAVSRRAVADKPAPTPMSDDDGEPDSGPFAWRDTLPAGAFNCLWNDPDAAPVLDYLRTVRRFSDATIKAWGLGALVLRAGGKPVERWLTIPLVDSTGKPVNVRFRRVPGACLYCSPDGKADGPGCPKCATKKAPSGTGRVPEKPKYRVCAKRPLPLFGVQNLTAPGSPVIVTEGELDVIALDDMGWSANVVSGTSGADADWPDDWLDRIERFPSFLLAFDDDDAGNKGAEKLADKLGRYRCSRARLPRKDAGDCLAGGVPVADVKAALDAAVGMVRTQIGTPGEWGAEIEQIIQNPNKLRGLQTSIQSVNDALGGLTPGLYVFTGETGEGKTTLATFLLWDLASRGTPALITSFEDGPVNTVMTLLRMEMGGDFTLKTPAERAAALAALDAKQIRIVKKAGDVTDDEVIEGVRYARRRRGCRIALIDHLDFITRVRRNGEDERSAKERVVRDLQSVSVDDDIIIALIVHPSNIANVQQRRVQLSDCKGASAIRQDAHGGLVVEKLAPTANRPFPAAMVHFDKVRNKFGQAGSKRMLAYDPLSCHFAQRWEDTPSGRAGIKVAVP